MTSRKLLENKYGNFFFFCKNLEWEADGNIRT